MSSNYPTALDAFATDVDNVTTISATEANNKSASIQALEKYAQTVINVRTFQTNGAKGDGSTDDTPAFNAAIAALPATGGTVFVPRTAQRYILAGQLNYASKNSVRIKGEGPALTGGQLTASTLQFTGTTGPQIPASGLTGVSFEDVQLWWATTFTGTVLDLSGTTFARLRNVTFLGLSGATATLVVGLDNATCASLDSCIFHNASVGVRGIATAGHFSNVVEIRDCVFSSSTGDISTAGIQNPGQGWLIQGCTFEMGTTAGTLNAIGQSLGGSLGVAVIGNWFGDAGTGVLTYIDINGDGWHIAGNILGSNSNASSILINQRSAANGLSVVGNRLQNSGIGITWGGSNNDVSVIGNRWSGVTTRYSGSPVSGILESATGSGGLQVFGSLQRSSQSIAFAASITPDATLGEFVLVGTLTGAITVNNPSNSAVGQFLCFRYTQDATGGRVVTYGANYRTGGAAAFSTTLSTVTVDRFFCEDGTIWRLVSRTTGQAI